MTQNYFSADLHFGHKNIIQHCNRPFDSIEQMDSILLENINTRVKRDDTLYILGDFAWFGCKRPQLVSYRKAIRCKNVHLILGNHDLPNLKNLDGLFASMDHMKEIQIQSKVRGETNIRLVMCHYAMRVWNQSHRGLSWNIFGHSHSNLPDDPKLLQMDVGVDCPGHNYSPVSFEQIKEFMSKKQWINPFDQWEKEGKLYRPDSREQPNHD